ncbi:outer membrane immunogenic protein [Tistlia consotensis]|uniref:Outer membrane immunogenic protein n=1 Tax=Tistlia consotensis USBA 355 TaxID=560819 RepID=A0A1Y6BZY0_9PROT|nr:outer membrane protein [Tistlia consotensis]SMF38538.1 outer membrane immunogenic protein [Tistlia consotensis USBA 355]SNR37080.1 outer membrane immunogenic protein [Tistlia consotensis]
MHITVRMAGTLAALAAALLLTPAAARAQGAGSSFDWSGAYAGVHAGWLWGQVDYHEPDFAGFAISPDLDGFQGGLLAGYNHQIRRFVLGAELDGGLGTADFGSGESGGNGYSAFDLDWNAHARGRVGYAFERTLVFVAGGLAVARLKIDDTDPGFGEDRSTSVGWTIGGGVEQAITDNLVLRLEYLYDDYGHASYTIDSPAGPFFPSYQAETDLTAHTLRAAVAWRF